MFAQNFAEDLLTATKNLDSETVDRLLRAEEGKLELYDETRRAEIKDALIKAEILCDLRGVTFLAEDQSDEPIELVAEISEKLFPLYSQFSKPMDRKLNLIADEIEKLYDKQPLSDYVAPHVERIANTKKIPTELMFLSVLQGTLMEDEMLREPDGDSPITETTKDRLDALLDRVQAEESSQLLLTKARSIQLRLAFLDSELGAERLFQDSQDPRGALLDLFANAALARESREFEPLPDRYLDRIQGLLEDVEPFTPSSCNVVTALVEDTHDGLRFNAHLNKMPGRINVRITLANAENPDGLRYKVEEFPCKLVDMGGNEYLPKIRDGGSIYFDHLPEHGTYTFKPLVD